MKLTEEVIRQMIEEELAQILEGRYDRRQRAGRAARSSRPARAPAAAAAAAGGGTGGGDRTYQRELSTGLKKMGYNARDPKIAAIIGTCKARDAKTALQCIQREAKRQRIEPKKKGMFGLGFLGLEEQIHEMIETELAKYENN